MFLGKMILGAAVPAALGLAAGSGLGNVSALLGFADAAAGSLDPSVRYTPTPPVLPRMGTADLREWAVFRRRFITADGRVIDTGNNGVSHTEGQGCAMLMAVACNDRPSFDRLLNWTRATLARPNDALLAWRYDPSKPNPVEDPNNATDGDLMIAWALWQASFRWNHEPYATQARAMAQDILDLLVVDVGARTLLLPGMFGFDNGNTVNINLSYYLFPALRDLSQAVPSPRWAKLAQDGLVLMDTGRFGRWMLPPDWLGVSRTSGALSPAAGWPPRFSYDAIRVPMYLAWGGHGGVAAQQAFNIFWQQNQPHVPAWVNLMTGDVAPYQAGPGLVAIAGLAQDAADQVTPRTPPAIHPGQDYYSASLILLTRLAAASAVPGSV